MNRRFRNASFRYPLLFSVFLAVTALMATACAGGGTVPASEDADRVGGAGDAAGAGGGLRVVATTGMVTDIARRVGGDRVTVEGLMGPGVDPHLYRATQGDMRRLDEADLVLYNGLLLEGRMADVFVRMAAQKPTVAVTEYIPEDQLLEPPEFQGHYDPHVWMDVSLWMYAVERVRDALIEADPNGRVTYEANAAGYLEELEALHAWAAERIAEIPERQRVLITAHDAFGYFGRAYDLEVVGLQGISTETELGLQDVQRMVDFILDRRIKAVFVESSVPPDAIEAVVEGARRQGHEVRIGGELFSDALGEAGTPEGTYVGMIRHNVDTIVEALR